MTFGLLPFPAVDLCWLCTDAAPFANIHRYLANIYLADCGDSWGVGLGATHFCISRAKLQCLALTRYWVHVLSEPRCNMRTCWPGHPASLKSTGGALQQRHVLWEWRTFLVLVTSWLPRQRYFWQILDASHPVCTQRAHRRARSWMPSPVMTKIFVKCSGSPWTESLFIMDI